MRRNRNENPENCWEIMILRSELRQLSPAQQLSADIIALYQRGQSQKKIAAALGVGHGSVNRIIAAANITRKRTPGAVQQQTTEIVALYQDGMGPKKIAENLGVGKTAVNRILTTAGVSKRMRTRRDLQPPPKR